MHHIVIVGSGPSGLTAAIYLARANMNVTVVEGDLPGGQLTTTTEVENFPGFPSGIMGPELMQNMHAQAERFGAKFVKDWVTSIQQEEGTFTLKTAQKTGLQADAVILSMGAKARMLEIPGETEYLGRGVSTCATCDGFFFKGKEVIIVGGGDSAMEEAMFLARFANKVTIVHRRNSLRASKIMQNRARENPKIVWQLDVVPVEVIGDGKKVSALTVVCNETKQSKDIPTDGIFIAIGHVPNTALVKNWVELDSLGYVSVQKGTTLTSRTGVFACGDIQDSFYRQAITSAGTGCMAALDSERFLDGNAYQDWSYGSAE
ncbi:MAG: thioredoxin-disulfide reductase [Bacilli bacterium]